MNHYYSIFSNKHHFPRYNFLKEWDEELSVSIDRKEYTASGSILREITNNSCRPCNSKEFSARDKETRAARLFIIQIKRIPEEGGFHFKGSRNEGNVVINSCMPARALDRTHFQVVQLHI